MLVIHRLTKCLSLLRLRTWRQQSALLALLLLVGIRTVSAQDEDEGGFTVRSADSELFSGVYFVNAIIDLQLTPEARRAAGEGAD